MRTSHKDSAREVLVIAGIIAIVSGFLPLAGTLLLAPFGYPDIIRETPDVILTSLHAARQSVPYLYYVGIGGAGVGIFFLVLMLSRLFAMAGEGTWSRLGKYCGMVDGLCLYGGIIRWTFLFPSLAAMRAEGTYDAKTVELVFEAFNTFVGDSIAEHVGFTFMFFWLLFMCVAILKTGFISKWIGVSGIVFSFVILYGNLEFFGFPGAFAANRVGAELVMIWLMALGVNLVLIRNAEIPNRVAAESNT